jgi:esterase
MMSPDDEFSMLDEVADEVGIARQAIPSIRRVFVSTDGGEIGAIVWAEQNPEMVFLHGGGQNAHTWDLVAATLGRPAVAIDLPGHGTSSWRGDKDYSPEMNAIAVDRAIAEIAPTASTFVGMSLGGLTLMALLAVGTTKPERVVIVDILPGAIESRVPRTQQESASLISGSRSFASLDDMVDIAVAASPRRPKAAVRRGVINNAKHLDDGSWSWRYDDLASSPMRSSVDVLWGAIERSTVPIMLVRGAESAYVADEQVAELLRRRPDARIEVVAGAGHSVQSEQPAALAALLDDFSGQ